MEEDWDLWMCRLQACAAALFDITEVFSGISVIIVISLSHISTERVTS